MRRHLTRSLSAHLRAAEDHSALPFHPSCPVCRRDRLDGSLDGEELVSRRTRAAIAAGLLAFSAGGTSAAVASPPDEVIEGTSEVIPGNDWSSDVDFDPGGGSDQLPDAAPLAPVASAPATDIDDPGPLEQEPTADTREPVENATPEPPADSEPVPAQRAPSPTVTAPGPATDSAVTLPTASAQTQPKAPEAQRGPKSAGAHRRAARANQNEAVVDDLRPSQSRFTEESAVAPTAVPIAPAQTATEPAPVTVRVVAHTSTERAAAKGQRFHTVQRGESLWSIAADVLGEDASVARIAREVQRLWELNDERIGTGRPDLLFAGTRLRLR